MIVALNICHTRFHDKKENYHCFKYLQNWVGNSCSLSALSAGGVMFLEQGLCSTQSFFCTFHSCEKVRIIYSSVLKMKCTTYISLLSFEEVLSTLYFSVVWRMMMIRDDQFGGPIMTNRKDLVGKLSTSVPTMTSLQCHSWFIPIVPGMRGMALEWGKDMNVRLSYFITNY